MQVVRRVILILLAVPFWLAASPPPSSVNANGQAKPRPRAAANSRAATSKNVILITLDTTRADRMDFLGSKRGLTPNLDILAKDSAVFTRAYSQVPLTPPSHATIMTGTYPQFNHVDDFESRLGKDVPYLPDILHARGYHTAAFVSSVILDPVHGSAPGFDRGFDVYDAGFHFRLPGEDRYQTIERRASEVVSHAETWLQKRRPGPFFMWLHFYDAHDPYDPPEPFKSKYADAPYDGEIAYVDSEVGKFISFLREKGLYDGAVIAVMADHGEALGDHGEIAHGVFLYDETIHVPLVIKLPGDISAGERIERRAGLVDVAPTVLQSLKVPVPKAMQGESLLPEMERVPGKPDPSSDRAIFSETDYPRKAFGFGSVRSWRTGKFLFVEAPRPELYDQSTDPGAVHDIASRSSAVVSTLTSQVDDFRQKTASTTAAPKTEMDPQAQAKLGALGYVASDDDIKVGPGIKDTGADCKDKIGTVNLLHDAIVDIENTNYLEAIPLLKKVVESDPGIPIAYMQLGTAYTWLKQYSDAIPVLKKAVEMRPHTMMSNYLLGLSLSETGDWADSVPYFEAAVDKSPKWGALHFSLAAAYARIDRLDDAQKELETAVQVEPKNFRAHLVLGRMLTVRGKAAEGIANLKEAVKLQPTAPEAHLFLADAYARAGQRQNAMREHAEAEKLAGSAKPQDGNPE